MNDFRKIRKLATYENQAKAWCREHYPGFEPVVVSSFPSDINNKTLFDIELRPPSQLKMEDY